MQNLAVERRRPEIFNGLAGGETCVKPEINFDKKMFSDEFGKNECLFSLKNSQKHSFNRRGTSRRGSWARPGPRSRAGRRRRSRRPALQQEKMVGFRMLEIC